MPDGQFFNCLVSSVKLAQRLSGTCTRLSGCTVGAAGFCKGRLEFRWLSRKKAKFRDARPVIGR